MPGFTFPGVYTQEQDFSLYLPAITTTVLGLVTTASKGPVDERVFVATEDQLIQQFGFPSTIHKGLLAAQQYLRRGNQLWIIRIAGYDEATASANIRNNGDTANAVTLTATSSGSWANGSSGLTLTVSNGDYAGVYTLQFKWNGFIVETHDNVNLTPTSDDFIDTRLAESNYATSDSAGWATDLKLGTISFSGGDDGAGVTAADYIGTSGVSPTGLKLFRDPKTINLNTFCAPGADDASVIAELISLAETRQDCFSLVDPPFGLDETNIVDWHNGVLGGSDKYPGTTLSSSYAALFWPWCQVYDSYNEESVWCPPSAFAAQQFAYTDTFYETWFAPAGYRRGKLQQVTRTEGNPSEGGGNYMYGGRAGEFGFNAVNPIMNFVGEGTVLWGNRTLQRQPTALDRINVRRCLLYLRKVIATAARFCVFEPNDERMWDEFKGLVVPFLRQVKAGRGLRDYRVVMDETTNPDSLIDQNQALGRILLKPTKSAEVLNINFAVFAQGANFDEFITSTAVA